MSEDYKLGADWASNPYYWGDTTKATIEIEDFESFTIDPPVNVGWVCPKCGAGLAPWVSRCTCQDKWEVTC